MNTNPKIQQSLKLKKKAQALLTRAIAKIMLQFRLPRSEIINSLDEKLVLEAKKQDPSASNVAIAIRTGIDRRYISKHLKGEMPRVKPNKMTVILEELRWTAFKYYGSNKLPKTGPFRTFQSVCEQRASGTLTYTAILEEFVQLGNIKDLGAKVELINFNFTLDNNEIDYSNLTAKQINKITDTLIFNSKTKAQKERLLQRSIYSTQIPPNKHSILHNELEALFHKYYDEIEKTFIRHETDVDVDTYPQYGVSLFEYKAEE
jgi:hypothetical protein